MVATEGWLDVSKTPALDLARKYADLEIAALIYTNIANDGMLQGIDDGTIADLVRLADLGFSVIASGGVTTSDDVRRLIAPRNASRTWSERSSAARSTKARSRLRTPSRPAGRIEESRSTSANRRQEVNFAFRVQLSARGRAG